MKKVLKDDTIFKIVYLLLGFLFFPTFLSSILFVFNISINTLNLPVSCIMLFITYYILFYKKSQNKRSFYIPLFITIVLITLSILLSCLLKENTWDGWAYHLPSVIKLSQGWNPIYNHDESIGIWSLHYPKFIWIYGGVLYNITGNMFAGTSFNLIMMFVIFFLTFDILIKKKLNVILSLIVSFCMAFNAIAIGQLFSYYNDGVLGNCVWGLLLIFYALSKKIYNIKENYIIILLIGYFASILANIKFDGALYAFIIVLVIFSYLLIKKELKFNKFLLVSCIIIGVSVLSIALTTYLPNIIYHHNIGYPIIGKDKIDIISWFLPDMFENKGKVSSFIISVFSNPKLDYFSFFPFYNINVNLIKSAISAESGRTGFGAVYQIILVISFLISILIFIKLISNKNKEKFTLKSILKKYNSELIIFVIIAILFYIIPATWWFRYVSYMYAFPLVIFIIFKNVWEKKNLNCILCYSLIGVYLLYSVVLSGGKLFSQYKYARNFNNNINEFIELANKNELNISVYDEENNYYLEQVREQIFKDYFINYNEIDSNECTEEKEFYIFGIKTFNCQNESSK